MNKNNELDDFEVNQEIKKNLSIKGYVYLINEYIELKSKMKRLHDKSEDKLLKLMQLEANKNQEREIIKEIS